MERGSWEHRLEILSSHISMWTQEGAANKNRVNANEAGFAEEDRVVYAGVYVFFLLP